MSHLGKSAHITRKLRLSLSNIMLCEATTCIYTYTWYSTCSLPCNGLFNLSFDSSELCKYCGFPLLYMINTDAGARRDRSEGSGRGRAERTRVCGTSTASQTTSRRLTDILRKAGICSDQATELKSWADVQLLDRYIYIG